MRQISRSVRVAWMVWACGLLWTGSAALGGQIAETAKLLPEDTVMVAAVENVKALGEQFKKTSLYALYKDPAMQRFIVPAEQKVREKFKEGMAEAGKGLNMDLPKDLPMPEGRIVAALRLETKVTQVPNMVYDEKEEKMVPQGTRNKVDTTPQVIVWADMGANVQGAKDLLDKIVEKGAERGAKRRTETIRGQQVFVVTGLDVKKDPPKRLRGKADDEALPAVRKEFGTTPAPTDPKEGKEDALVYMFQGNVLVAGNSLELFAQVLARAGGESLANLADDADMRAAFRAAGGEGDVSLYVNAKPLLKLALDEAGEGPAKEKTTKMLATLGADNITGAVATFALAAGEKEDGRLKLLLRVKGPKHGIPAMLAGVNRSTQPEAALTAGLSGFLVANHDLGAIVDQTVKMITSITGQPISAFMQSTVATTAGPEGNPPAVDLKTEVLDQLTKPVIVTTRMGPDGAEDFLVSIGLRNAATFDKAFGRIHTTFLTQGKEDARRELRKSSIYPLPQIRGIFGALTGGGEDGEAAPKPEDTPALAVVGAATVFGKLGQIEQTIRNQGRADLPGIATDKMYQHAAPFLPAQASLWSYGNQQVSMEAVWKMLKTAAAAKADELRARRSAMPGPMMLVEGLKEICDFSTLPDYADIKKHFGVSIGYLKDADEGLLMEAVYIKSPDAPSAKP